MPELRFPTYPVDEHRFLLLTHKETRLSQITAGLAVAGLVALLTVILRHAFANTASNWEWLYPIATFVAAAAAWGTDKLRSRSHIQTVDTKREQLIRCMNDYFQSNKPRTSAVEASGQND